MLEIPNLVTKALQTRDIPTDGRTHPLIETHLKRVMAGGKGVGKSRGCWARVLREGAGTVGCGIHSVDHKKIPL